ncbi:hypothetical protein [Mycobacteroides chelonae]|uniref:hypothetical protein n=1 Tax=Mycobacteroides chelonae TaxID=1774 RepID=UPI0012FFC80B|nr:hypothetical protein [Mycobacteroides chelonae]
MLWNVILVAVLVLSQLAGIAGFVLGVYNYRQSKKSHKLATDAHKLAGNAHQLALDLPKLNDQRKYREELRSLLYPVKQESEAALSTLRRGGEVSDTPECIEIAKRRINELIPLMNSMPLADMYMADLRIGQIQRAWEDLDFQRRSTALRTDEQKRVGDAARHELREMINQGLEEIEKIIKTTIDKDRT